MPANVGVLSPSVYNIAIPKGFGTIQRTLPVADAAPYALGKLSNFSVTGVPTIVDHVDESQGIGVVDISIVSQISARFKATLDEVTVNNLGLYMFGTPNLTSPSAVTVPFFGNQTATYAKLVFVQTNGQGARYQITINNALVAPEGDWELVSDQIGKLPLAGRFQVDFTNQWGSALLLPSANSVAPTNYVAPFILGSSSPGSDPTHPLAVYGSALYADPGNWTAGSLNVTYAYQWYTNTSQTNTGGTAISGATGSTFTPVSADASKYLYFTLAVTNSVGTTTVASSNVTAAVS